MAALPAEDGAVGECLFRIGAQVGEDGADDFADFGGFAGGGGDRDLGLAIGTWESYRLVAGGDEPIKKRLGVIGVGSGRKEDGGGREPLDELPLDDVEVVETVEKNLRLWERIWRAWLQPFAKLLVRGGEFAVFSGLAG